MICLADVAWHDGSDVEASPRQILRRQLARLAERGWSANAGTELEFMVFLDTYEQAWESGYRELRPANQYNVDYSLLGTARVEPLVRRIRNSMAAAGMVVEDSKGECNFGQHEINFRYADALRTADDHAIFKNGAKEIAAEEGVAITFMAKYDAARGQLVPHPLLARRRRRAAVRARPPAVRFVPRRAAGLPARAHAAARAERQLLQALRRRDRSRRRPSRGARTTARAHCASSARARRLRFENRVGGADLNPYLALSALIASGLHGVEQGLELEPALEGNAYAATDHPRVPATLPRRASCSPPATWRATAFGEEVVAHYVNAADVELRAFESAVTDWERVRGFERL